MPIIPDGDLLAFFWTTAAVVFGSRAQIRKNTPKIPAKYELEEISDAQLTSAQKGYLRPIDAQLEAINYRPDCTFRATNYGHNLMRRYSNPADPASCELTVVEVKSRVGNVETAANVNTVSFTSRLSDGRRLNTRNMPLKSVMDRLPHQIVQEFPNLTDLAALKRKHDSRVAQLGPVLSPPHGAKDIFAEMQCEHERFCAYQVSQGVLRPTPEGRVYEITNKAANRGIFNFFNPFSKRVALPQTLLSALVGAFFPLVGILKIAPAIHAATGNSPLAFQAPILVIIAFYALAGVLMALIGGPQSYTWIMLVTYVPAHFLAGWTFGWLPYSSIAHVVCYYVGQANQRRSLVLQT
jgi:hypothetical protein